MLYENPVGTRPTVADSATIHTSAKIIGNVYIGDNVYIGPNAVIRADEPCLEGNLEGVIVEPGVNIQQRAVPSSICPRRSGHGVHRAPF